MSNLGVIPNLAPSTTRSEYDGDSSASSGQKRRRDGSPSQSTSFQQQSKNKASQRSNTRICWNCEATHTEFCHVVARTDPAHLAMSKKGMLTFGGLGDFRNSIVLCGSCHNHFDRTSNTGWVFLPVRLDWFIEWEKEDFIKRKNILTTTGTEYDRTYPDEKDYEAYTRKIGLLSDPDDGLSRGGFYQSYILEDMFPPVMTEALRQRGMEIPGILPGGPKRWYGAPMAALNRGFVVMGAPEFKLPEKESQLLHTLQGLYSRKLSSPKDSQTSSRQDSQATIDGSRSEQHRTNHGQHSAGDLEPSLPPTATGSAQSFAGPSQVSRQVDSGIALSSTSGRKRQRDNNSLSLQCEIEKKKPKRRTANANASPGIAEDSWCYGPRLTSEQIIRVELAGVLSDN